MDANIIVLARLNQRITSITISQKIYQSFSASLNLRIKNIPAINPDFRTLRIPSVLTHQDDLVLDKLSDFLNF